MEEEEEEEEKRRNIPVQQLPLPNLLPLTSTLLNPKANNNNNNNNNKAIDEGSQLQLQLQLASDETQSTPPPPQPSSHSSSSNDEEDEEEEETEDWEAIADRDLDVSFPSDLDATILSSLSLDSSNVEVEASKHHQVRRRGRGSFMYERDGLYSDQQTDPPNIYSSSSENEAGPSHSRSSHDRAPYYGTRHILILAGFPASFRTLDLEKDFDAFKDRGFAIRWIDDTTAVAVFPTPALAYEALKNVSFTYSVRVLEENDKMFGLVSAKDLEPPRPRPKTSPRTAQRLIAQGMGRKPSTDFSSEDLRKQEEARRNRIQMRHKLREDAWEDNEP